MREDGVFGDVEVGAVGRCEGWFDFGGGGAEGGLLFGDGLVGEVGVFCLLFFHVCLVLYCIVLLVVVVALSLNYVVGVG